MKLRENGTILGLIIGLKLLQTASVNYKTRVDSHKLPFKPCQLKISLL